MKQTETIGGWDCTLYTMEGARILLLQPVDEHDRSLLDSEVELIRSLTEVPFHLVAFRIKDWMSELTPWPAPPTFGKQPFGNGAEATLRGVVEKLLPALQERFGTQRTILGGYSLAGLFSLWAGYNATSFDGIAAASPSVWYPQWTDYIEGEKMRGKAVYLSLGDRESRTKNPVRGERDRSGANPSNMDDAIRKQHDLLVAQGIATLLEWNPGGHFVDSEQRLAKAFGWVAKKLYLCTSK